LDPPLGDPQTGNAHEWNHARWMARNPHFRLRAKERIDANGSPLWTVLVYERL
jgi:hypothetical protein